MGGLSIIDSISVRQGIANTATGTTSINGDIIDTSGYQGVLFLCKFTTAAANNTIKAQQGAVANMSDAADLLGSSVAVGASDELVWIELTLPRERYVRMVALRGTTTVIEWGVAILFGARSRPALNAVAGTLAGEKHVAPIEGTA